MYFDHILECVERVKRYTATGPEAVYADEMAPDATLRNLQTLAESCSRLPPGVRGSHPEIHWRGIAGFRNAVVHEYLQIDLELVWRVIENDLGPRAAVIADELATLNLDREHEKGTP